MISLGSVIFFRWEKCRLVSVSLNVLAFHFCTIIAETCNAERALDTTRYW